MSQPVPSHAILGQCGVPGPFQHRPDNFGTWDQFPEVGLLGAFPTLDEACSPLLQEVEWLYGQAMYALKEARRCNVGGAVDFLIDFGRHSDRVSWGIGTIPGAYDAGLLTEASDVSKTLSAAATRALQQCGRSEARAEELLKLLEAQAATAEEAPGAMPGLQPLAGAIGGGAPSPANPPPGAIYQRRPGESLETYTRRMATWRRLLAGRPIWKQQR